MATFIVTNTDDSGPGSLRLAIEQANASTGADRIEFDSAVSGGTLVLTSGALLVTDDLTIDGPGADNFTIDAVGSSAVLIVDDGDVSIDRQVTLSGLTIRGGYVGYDAQESGGGVTNREQTEIRSSIITGNSAIYGAAGVNSTAGDLTIVNTVVKDNSSQYIATGGIRNSAGSLRIYDSVVENNKSLYSVGGIDASGDLLILNQSDISGNGLLQPAEYGGGGILSRTTAMYVYDSRISGNDGGGGGGPEGGLVFRGDTLTIGRSIITNHNDGYLAIPGVFSSGYSLTVFDTLFAYNGFAGLSIGGSSYNQMRSIEIKNSTFYKNYEGIQNLFQNATGNLSINNSTIFENKYGVRNGNTDLSVIVSSTIITGSDAGLDVTGEVSSGGNNLVGTGNTSGFNQPGDLVIGAADPRLGPLSDNGGPTPTVALLPGSPAIDAGANPQGLAFDQRGEGFLRVANGQTDIGAFEVQETTPPADIIGTDDNDTIAGTDAGERIEGLAGRDRVLAGAGNDAVFGGPGDDRLNGEAGNDLIDGGPGRDVIVGGPGGDIFILADGDTFDLLRDFTIGEDLIQVQIASVDRADLKVVDNGSSALLQAELADGVFTLANIADAAGADLDDLLGPDLLL